MRFVPSAGLCLALAFSVLIAAPLSVQAAQSCKPSPDLEIRWVPLGTPVPGAAIETEIRVTTNAPILSATFDFDIPAGVQILSALPDLSDLPPVGETRVHRVSVVAPLDASDFPHATAQITTRGGTYRVGGGLNLRVPTQRGRLIQGIDGQYLDRPLPRVARAGGLGQGAQAPQALIGRVLYRDRLQDDTGFIHSSGSGSDPYAPVRYANLELLKNGGVDQTGFTALDGTFSFTIPATSDDWSIRVTSRTDNSGLFTHRVRTPGNAYYSYTSGAIQAPGGSGDLGDFLLEHGAGGEEFNILDEAVSGALEYFAVDGSYPGSTLNIEWDDTSSPGSFYGGGQISLLFSDDWDDSVILHEYGHYIDSISWITGQPGGAHFLTDSEQDPRLSFGEGFGTYWMCAVKQRDGENFPTWYIDTTGGSGAGGLGLSYDNEGPSISVIGLASEVIVSATLYDIIDGAGALGDGTPGVDDENLEVSASEVWEALNGPEMLVGFITLEDFWDSWFDVSNGFFTDMQFAFSRHSVKLWEDAAEPDPSPGTVLPTDGTSEEHTFYASSDTDVFRIVVPSGEDVAVETSLIRGWGDTEVNVQGPVGNILINVTNDDKGGDPFSMQDVGSLVEFTAPATGAYEVTVTRRFKNLSIYVQYGSYNIEARIGTPIDPTAPVVALHAKSRAAKATLTCTTESPNTLGIACSDYLTEWPTATSADVYLVVAKASVADGVGGVSVGLDYDAAAGSGTDVFGWTLCADLEFAGGSWPASGGGNRITWITPSNCQTTVIAPDDVHAVAGAFYTYAYTDDIFALDLNRTVPTAELKVADCDAAETDVALSAAGFVAFGAGLGCSPCDGPCGATINTTPTCPLASIQINAPMTPVQFTASGAFPPVTWSAVDLPPGLMINTSTGEVSGTPTSLGTYPFFVAVHDARGADAIECSITVVATVAAEPTPGAAAFSLAAAYPNPFRSSTAIGFQLPEASEVRLTVFDSAGRRVRTLVDGYRDAGSHLERWDGRRDDGARVTAGIYFTQLRAGAETRAGKIVLAPSGR